MSKDTPQVKKPLSLIFVGVLATAKFDKSRAILAIKEADRRMKYGYKLNQNMKNKYNLIKKMINENK